MKSSFRRLKTATPFFYRMESDFGMVKGSKVEVNYNITSLDSNIDNYFLMLLLTKNQYEDFYNVADDTHTSVYNSLCTSPSEMRIPITSSGIGKFEYNVDFSSLYSFAVMECRTIEASSSPLYSVDVSLMNPSFDGSQNNIEFVHLGMELIMSPRASLGLSILYAFIFSGVIWQLATVNNGNQIKPVHFLMLITVILFFIAFLVNYVYLSKMNDEGETDYSLYSTVLFIYHLAISAFFVTIVLVSMGWQILRPGITSKEFTLIAPILILFISTGLFYSTCVGDKVSSSCEPVGAVNNICRSLILLGLIIAGNITMTNLKTSLSASPWAPSIPIIYARLRQYTILRNVFLLYIILPVIFQIIKFSMFSWREIWIFELCVALCDVLFTIFVIILFGPVDMTSVTRPFDGSLGVEEVLE